MKLNWNVVTAWVGAPLLCYDCPDLLDEAFTMGDLASGLLRLRYRDSN